MGFFDLNIPYESSQSSKATRLKLVIKAMELGYTGVAYNHTIKGVMSDRDRCSIARFSLSSLLNFAPSLASSVSFHRDLLGVPRSAPFRQYTRLTVCVDNPTKSQALNSGNSVLKTYDLVAVRPLNQAAFDHACEKAEVDIISVDFSEKMPFRLKQHMVKAAIQRGVYFEINYADLIFDVQVRRQMISNAKRLDQESYLQFTKRDVLNLALTSPHHTFFQMPKLHLHDWLKVFNICNFIDGFFCNSLASMAALTLLDQYLQNAKMLVDWTRGRNIILSSGAPSVCEFRGPCDVANLSSLLGLSTERAKAAISKNCRNLIAVALRKKHFYKEAIRVEVMPSDGESDQKEPLSLDWLKWDPISSGEGDLQLEDMVKSFSATAVASKSVKAIDFDSIVNGIAPQNGSFFSAFKVADVTVATTEMSEKLGGHAFTESDKNSLSNPSSINPKLDFRSSKLAYLRGSEAKSGNCGVIEAPIMTTEEPKSTSFPNLPCPLVGTEVLDLQSKNSFTSSERDANLPTEDTVCQDSAMDIGLTAPLASDNTAEISEDLTFHDKPLEKIIDPQDLDAVRGSEHCLMDESIASLGVEDRDAVVTEDMCSGENKKSVDELILVDNVRLSEASGDMKAVHISSALDQESLEEAAMEVKKSGDVNIETLSDVVMTDNEYKVVNHETQEEVVMEKQEQTLEELVTVDHGDMDSQIVLGVENLEAKDDSTSENLITSMEVESKKPKHKEADTQSDVPPLFPSLPEKSKVKGSTVFQPLKFPLRRLLNPTSFKRKSRKSKRKRL